MGRREKLTRQARTEIYRKEWRAPREGLRKTRKYKVKEVRERWEVRGGEVDKAEMSADAKGKKKGRVFQAVRGRVRVRARQGNAG